MLLPEVLMGGKALMPQGKRNAGEDAPRRKCTVSWLTGKLRVYLKGF
jgi:hypothetical protein